jgi:hypothetical protein
MVLQFAGFFRNVTSTNVEVLFFTEKKELNWSVCSAASYEQCLLGQFIVIHPMKKFHFLSFLLRKNW